MGVSSDGILVYGIPYPEDAFPEFLEEYDGDFDAYLEDQSGLPKWGEEGHDFKDHFAYRDACPADVVTHCSYEYPMYILAVRNAKFHNSRGEVVDVPSLDVAEDKLDAFKTWCAERGIDDEPRWCLVSMYG